MVHHDALACDILNWLARLPFLAAADLALLTGQPLPDVEATLRELDSDHHVDWVTPSSPELDASRLYVLTEPARQHIANESRQGEAGRSLLPVTRGDVIHRLARLEATAALNEFVASLVTLQRRSTDAAFHDVWSVPVRRPRDAWWPPGVDAFGCYQSAHQIAPFFILVDRAGTPAVHRAALIAGWHHFRDRQQRWGRDRVPAILVLCPDSEREAEWARQVQASADRRGVRSINVVLANRADLALVEQLAWWRSPTPSSTGRAGGGLPPTRPETRARLHSWAHAKAAGGRGIAEREHVAALALTTGSVEKQLLDCLGRHPLLTTAELGVVLGIAPRIARHAVKRALQNGLILSHGGEGDSEDRYCLSMLAVRVLATRDGVPFRRYLHHSRLTAMAPETGRGVPAVLRQRDHTVGANSFFLGMLARTTGHCRLARWEGATEAVAVFSVGGERRTVRPDGAGIVVSEGHTYRFFLEWDRGTERIAVLLEKLARYANYYRVQTRTSRPLPTLLVACPSPQREDVLWRAATTVFANESTCHCLLTTTHPHLDLEGPFGSIWRGYGCRDRQRWPGVR